MTKQQKLEAIYEAMADQTLSAGCAVEFRYKNWAMMEYWWDEDAWGDVINIEYVNSKWYTDGDFNFPISDIKDWWYEDLEWHIKIIWHPVRIGDVLEYMEINPKQWVWWGDRLQDIVVKCILWCFENKRLPIDEQSDECIEYVYSLISN